MSEGIDTNPSGINQPASSSVEVKEETPVQLEQDNKVQYETHKKLLGEKKALQAKYEALELQLQASKEKELREKEDFKSIAEMKQKEAEEYKAKLDGFEQQERDRKKLSSFIKTLETPLERQYWQLIPLDEIIINPDTGEVDQMSVTKVVEDYRKTYGATITSNTSTKMPNAAAKGGSIGLTREQWKALPYSEMMKRQNEVID